MSSEQQQLGELIRQQRKNKKMTQAELGKLLNIGKVAISDYEKGKVKIIPFEKRIKISKILDIPLYNLMYSDETLSTEEAEKENENYITNLEKSLCISPEDPFKLVLEGGKFNEDFFNKFRFNQIQNICRKYGIKIETLKENNEYYRLIQQNTGKYIVFDKDMFLEGWLDNYIIFAQMETNDYFFNELTLIADAVNNGVQNKYAFDEVENAEFIKAMKKENKNPKSLSEIFTWIKSKRKGFK